MLRRFWLFSLVIITLGIQTVSAQDPVLFSVDDEPVHLSEFTYVYEKSNGQKADYSATSVEEFMDLYTKFKLKVIDAKRQGLEDNPELKSELSHYRAQLAENYMSDKAVLDHLTKELYDRMQEEVDVSHILIRTPPNAPEQMRNQSIEELRSAKKTIESGISFSAVAKRYSHDRSVNSNGGHLGYRVAKLPNGFYALESAIYNTPVGEISEPVESKLGLHIVQVLEKRPARGEIAVRHILTRKSRAGIRDTSEQKIQRIYAKLQAGESFQELAKQYSEDQNTSSFGGDLGSFKVGTYAPEFEDAAFALEADGDYTEPVETEFGWHIIQRVSLKKLGSYEEEKRRLEAMVKDDLRYELAKSSLIEKIKVEENFDMADFSKKSLQDLLGPDVYNLTWKKPEVEDDFTLFSIGEKAYRVSGFVTFLEGQRDLRYQSGLKRDDEIALSDILNAYIDESIYEYEKAQLEDKYPEFKEIMREYREGIMLFEVSKSKIWDRVGADTVGLRQYYDAHRSNYHADRQLTLGIYEVKTTKDEVIDKMVKRIKRKSPEKVLKKYNKASEVVTFAKETRGEQEFISDFETETSKIENAAIVLSKNLDKGTTRIAKIEEISATTPLSFEEAKGAVMSDYQTFLEEEWVKELKQKYDVVVNNKVLESLYP